MTLILILIAEHLGSSDSEALHASQVKKESLYSNQGLLSIILKWTGKKMDLHRLRLRSFWVIFICFALGLILTQVEATGKISFNDFT